jgi:hypothetical protein
LEPVLPTNRIEPNRTEPQQDSVRQALDRFDSISKRAQIGSIRFGSPLRTADSVRFDSIEPNRTEPRAGSVDSVDSVCCNAM